MTWSTNLCRLGAGRRWGWGGPCRFQLWTAQEWVGSRRSPSRAGVCGSATGGQRRLQRAHTWKAGSVAPRGLGARGTHPHPMPGSTLPSPVQVSFRVASIVPVSKMTNYSPLMGFFENLLLVEIVNIKILQRKCQVTGGGSSGAFVVTWVE